VEELNCWCFKIGCTDRYFLVTIWPII